MGFNYGREKRKFEEEWKQYRDICLEAGMSKEAIHTIYEYECQWFRSRRIYESHTQPYPSESIANDAERSALSNKFSNLVTELHDDILTERFMWIETITDPKLAAKIKSLSSDDLELLTFVVIEGHSQKELARLRNCIQQSIAKKYKKIKIFLK